MNLRTLLYHKKEKKMEVTIKVIMLDKWKDATKEELSAFLEKQLQNTVLLFGEIVDVNLAEKSPNRGFAV